MHRFDRVLIVDSGRVVADLPPAEVQACLDRGELDALSESGRELVAELAQASAAATAIGLKGDNDQSMCACSVVLLANVKGAYRRLWPIHMLIKNLNLLYFIS